MRKSRSAGVLGAHMYFIFDLIHLRPFPRTMHLLMMGSHLAVNGSLLAPTFTSTQCNVGR